MSKNIGALFKNKKDGVEARPDYRGDLTIDGVKYRLSAWINKDKNGNSYLALQATADVKAPKAKSFDDDVPF